MRLLFVVALCLLTACCASVPNVYEQTKPALVKLEWGSIQCSGVATGPHSILTATHCIKAVGKRAMTIDGKVTDYVVVANDGQDHTLLRVTLTQKHTTPITHGTFRIGQTLFVWGHPQGLPSVMRLGRVAGLTDDAEFCFEGKVCSVVFLDANLTHGDSGAPIFDESGQLVGLESGGAELGPWTQCFFFPLAFTPAQLAEASS